MPDITIYYLQMLAPDELLPADGPGGLLVTKAETPQYRVNRFLYQFVGEHWQWRDQLRWSDAQWQDYAESGDLHTWIAYENGSPAGYYELQRQPGGDVEIKYFGLAPPFIGKGYGGYLLTHALRSAWQMPGTRRVWVHTCTLDHPGALANYQARGMQLYRTETEAA
jgi:GNAT superfamily N-acetyltransferase